MNEQEIDKLLLEIEVDDKTQGGSKKLVNDFATAVSKLNEQIAHLDVSKFETITKAMSAMGGNTQSLKKQNAELKKQNDLLNESAKKLKEALDAQSKATSNTSTAPLPQAQGGTSQQIDEQDKETETVETYQRVNTQLEIYQRQLEIIQEKLQAEGITEEKYLSLKKQELALVEKIKNAESDSADNDSKKTVKKANSLTKLMKAVGRIAIYRAIRSAIKQITQALSETIDGIVKYNKELQGTMSSLQSSLAKLKTSAGVGLYQVLIMIEPIIVSISNGVVELANSLSKVTANLRGVAEYTKINTEYMKEYQSATQGALLSFDTFNTLGSNQGIDYSKMLDTGTDALDETKFSQMDKTLKVLVETLKGLWEIVKQLLEAVGPSLIEVVNDLLPAVLDAVRSIVNLVDLLVDVFGDAINATTDFIVVVVQSLSGAIQLISGLLKVLTGDFDGAWEDISKGFTKMISGIVNSFISLINFIVDNLNVVVKPIAKFFGKDWEIPDITWKMDWQAKSSYKNYAFGGGYSSADLFYANENGQTELIASTNSGGGAVMNMQQLESAIYSGMIKAMASNSSNGESAVYLDGNKVGTFIASNSGFRSEANRRMTGLNWR